ncbi:MAG: AAA family ATPase [Bacillota bacterium]
MCVVKEIPPERLRRRSDPSSFPFDTTESIALIEGIIGQERAVRALDFGLSVSSPGYNIYVSGLTGTGRTTYARSAVQKVAGEGLTPGDWVYVNNFEEPDRPLAIALPCGMGHGFAQEVDDLIEELKREVKKAFESDEYARRKDALMKKFQEVTQQVLNHTEAMVKEKGFSLVRTTTGFGTIPMMQDRAMTPEEFEALDGDSKANLEAKSQELQTEIAAMVRKVKDLEKKARERLKGLDEQMALFAVGHHVNDIKEKYRDYPKIGKFMDSLKDEVVSHIDDFRGLEEQPSSSPQAPWARTRDPQAVFNKYKVNVLVNNAECRGAPVIFETNPTYYNLLGKIEYKGQLGIMVTDFTMIKPGALHRANGGYLILHAADVLKYPLAWDGLKRTLRNREIKIENMGEQLRADAVVGLQPEAIPLDVKVIMIGSPWIYQALYVMDEDFRKLFKVRADFDMSMARTQEHAEKYGAFIGSVCSREGLIHFDREAVARVIEYSSRLVEDQEKLSTRFNDIVELLYEANAWAKKEHSHAVSASHVDQALEEKAYRSMLVEEKIQEMILRDKIMVDTSGEAVGQINGLSIYDMGDYSFGRPSRITAKAFIGRAGVVNIEREIRMSGTIHSKGVLILAGYLGAKYAHNKPLALSASLCFEQNYEGVDGDSASSTELYALLSELSGLPVKQSIAVTGSVNQRGEIQPVGGVTRKIEGFFAVCKARGLDGSHGAIIPSRNVDNLMLKEEVLEAVRQGLFRVWSVDTIDEGLEILTGVPAGIMGPDGEYPKDTVHGRVDRRLAEWAETMSKHGPGY